MPCTPGCLRAALAVTLGVLEEAAQLGVTRLWLQPGSEDADVIARAGDLNVNVIHGGPCVLVELGYYSLGGPGATPDT